jgi:cytochrome c oxidase subunit 2
MFTRRQLVHVHRSKVARNKEHTKTVQSDLPLYPEQASNFAMSVDALMVYITAICAFFAVAITAAVIYFFFKYRRKHPGEVGFPIHGDMRLETAWIVVPLFLALTMFGWGAVVYVDYRRVPMDTLDIYVIGKQWMWKIQQPTGLREINELHVPVGRNIKLILASEDVIHDFSVPAFRVKMDVVPGHYNTMWFRPTKAGRYHFFCQQYCGTNHALMGGWVTVMEPMEYAAWLSGSSDATTNPVVAGEKLFAEKACTTCHSPDGSGRAPSLNGVYGANVLLADGSTVAADDAYIRESILNPQAKIVAGYQPLMPSFQGQLTEEQIMDLTSYIKSLQSQPVPTKGSGVAPSTGKK